MNGQAFLKIVFDRSCSRNKLTSIDRGYSDPCQEWRGRQTLLERFTRTFHAADVVESPAQEQRPWFLRLYQECLYRHSCGIGSCGIGGGGQSAAIRDFET